MQQSKFLTEKLLGSMQQDAMQEDDDGTDRPSGPVDRASAVESITLMDSRNPTESIAQVNFKFKNPVSGDDIYVDSLIKSVQDSIANGSLEVMDRILQSIGMAPNKPKQRKVSSVNVNIGKYGRYRKAKSEQGLRDGRGKFISEINLRNALKLATIANVVSEMKSPGTDGLRYRTGRLQYSVDLKPLRLKSGTLSIFYTYMVRPYSVFDPNVSRYHGLSSNQRNPQKLITDQLQKQATQLGIQRYKLDIKQHWRRS